MICIASSSSSINNYTYILILLFIASTCGYVLKSNDIRHSHNDQQLELNSPFSYNRVLRSVRFPRIGRSSSKVEDTSFVFNSNTNSEQVENNDLRSNKQRSVLLPRIGKRTFPDLIWYNSLSSAHHILDAQDRSSTTSDKDYQNQPILKIYYRVT